MSYSRKLLAPMVSSAVALIAVTNYSIVRLLGHPDASPSELLDQIWPMALPASIAVVLVMSSLYQALQELLAELDRKQSELKLVAQRDALTGVASRQLFEERLQQAILRFRRSREKFAILILDLDDFKRVNDLHGHQTGDELLKEAAARLASFVRDSDTVARFGGDEFLILQTQLKDTASVGRLCKRLCSGLQEPYELDSLELRLPASIGAVVASSKLQTASDYVRAADIALYDAKASGRNCFRFFCEDLDQRLRRRDVLETDLRSALQNESGVTVHFQPQISACGVLTGVEALFRWTHPVYGDIPASEAVSIAEDAHIIDRLGKFVFRRAAALARKYPSLSFAVNLSPAQFSCCDNLARTMCDLAAQEKVGPEQFELEVTEQLFMDVGNGCDLQMQNLRKSGFRLALDDFGTGYSSLSYLRRFQVDRLKLDKSFAASGKVGEDIAVLRAAVSLAHLLGLEVVAEGIETKAQEAAALESGCDALQGHKYGSPMLAEDFELYVHRRTRSAA